MAEFNPRVNPTQDPNFLGYSKVPDTPDRGVDKSTGLALAGLGDSISVTAKTGDDLVKQQINEEVRSGVETERNAYTSALQRANQTGVIPGANPLSLAADDNGGSAIPAGLQAGLDRASAIGSAGTGSTKINDTYYTMRLNAMATNLRNQYPGYKDYIDQRMSAISGMDPANAYYKNLMEDLNTKLSSNKSARDKISGEILKHIGLPDVDKIYMGYTQGILSDNAALKLLSDRLAPKYKHDQWQRNREETQGTREDAAITATEQFNSEAATLAFNKFNLVLTLPGLSNPATINKLIDDANTGRITLNDQQNQALLSAMVSARSQVYQELRNMANQRGYTSRIGDPDKVNKYINSQLSIYDDVIDKIKNKEYGSAFSSARAAEAMINDSTREILEDKDVGAYSRTAAVFNKVAGPQWAGWVSSMGLRINMAPKYQQYFDEKVKKSQVPNDIRQDGVVRSLYADIKDAKKKNMPKMMYNNLFENIDTIINPKAPETVKKAVIDYAFNPNNLHIMDEFKRDYTDPQTGKRVAGSDSIFQRLTRPDIIDNVWNTTKGDQSWKNFKEWGEQSFGTLFREDIQTLNSIQTDRAVPIRFNWDADNHRLIVTDPKGQPLRNTNHDRVTENYINSINTTVNRINNGLYNISKINEKDGIRDTNDYVLGLMMQLGFRPGENATGLPQQIMDAVAAGKRSTSKKFEDTFRPFQ